MARYAAPSGKVTLDLGHGNPKQLLFWGSRTLYTAFGGARGGGKTHAVRIKAVAGAVKHSGIKILIVRRHYDDLQQNHIEPIRNMVPAEIGSYNGAMHTMYFINGSTIRFGHFNDITAENSYRGQEYHWIFIDEATQFTEREFRMLAACLRSADDIPKRFYLTCNPGGVGHCVPYGEILTPSGWRDIREIKTGDELYTVTPDKLLETEKATQIHRYRDSVNYVNARGLHMALTDEHKVMTANGDLVRFCDLPGQATIARSVEWQGTPIGEVDIQTTIRPRTTQPTTISGPDYATLLGWYLSEGNLVDRDYLVSIAQMKPATRAKLKAFLLNAGFEIAETSTAINLYGYGLWSKLKSYNFGKCRDKYVPIEIKNATTAEMAAFMTAAVDGDGHWSSANSGQYYTTSARLADDMQELFVKLGYITTMSTRQRENREGLSYCISFKKTKSGGTELLTGNHVYDVQTATKRKSNIARGEAEDVYCVGVEKNHSFVIRQNGSVWISGNSWVKRLFVDRKFNKDPDNPEADENPDDYTFIQATVEDNEDLMKSSPEYVKQLAAMPEDMRRAHRYGDWDALSGGYFPEFTEKTHVIPPFKIPPDWIRYRTMDYGLDMLAVHWVAVDTTGRAYVYRELTAEGKIVSDAAAMILDNTSPGEQIAITIAPPDLWSTLKDSGKTMAELFMLNGVNLYKGNNSRVQGWLQMKEMLAPMSDDEPGLKFFDTCHEIIKDLKAIQRDEKNPNDCAKQPHDITHTCDSIRYFCQSRTLSTDVNESSDDWFDDDDVEDYGEYMTGGEVTASYLNY